eukprot:NODE_329_length_9526_cov_0.701708.p6 type:complete len:212 gc:universal NODE_329_length_9526_cov_0.701708:1379-2014(+)
MLLSCVSGLSTADIPNIAHQIEAQVPPLVAKLPFPLPPPATAAPPSAAPVSTTKIKSPPVSPPQASTPDPQIAANPVPTHVATIHSVKISPNMTNADDLSTNSSGGLESQPVSGQTESAKGDESSGPDKTPIVIGSVCGAIVFAGVIVVVSKMRKKKEKTFTISSPMSEHRKGSVGFTPQELSRLEGTLSYAELSKIDHSNPRYNEYSNYE